MVNDSKLVAEFSPPVTNEPVVAMIAFLDGRAYLAPAGSTLDDPQDWLLVESLAQAADRIGVEWVARA